MSFYNLPEDMYNSRANRFKKKGDECWAKAKRGEGDYFYQKARKFYQEAERNRELAKLYKGKGWKS